MCERDCPGPGRARVVIDLDFTGDDGELTEFIIRALRKKIRGGD